MVRVFLKGGVWKNSEDEILKAAIQKYGKQQWARVASLLNRKSAKQCKARWHEWLDPSVRKVEWSREEEEKLLHLAKLMPAQWKTIGPLVGRTATQCQEHYERLLDEAAAGGKTENEDGTEASLRSQPLRVGQIDSHPETKPARPDPIDMDEDEIEMLQEARARLANTLGKKAKRKNREKMLAEAKRLAELQKRRELKQAGLLSTQAKKKARKRNREIDYGVEIPFHKPAPAGFHDVTSEAARAESIRQRRLNSVDFKKLNEQQYRTRDREAAKAKKKEEARLRTLEKSNMAYVVAEVSKKNDPLNIRKRGPLDLPAPSVSDQELKQMAKMDAAAAASAIVPSSGSEYATQALLADYSDRPLPTPMRTPMVGGSASTGPSRQESIMRQATNLRLLERGQTPLLGGDNPELEGFDDDGGDQKPAARPTTPGGPIKREATPHRDRFGLNRPQSELRGGLDDTASVGASTFATSAMSIRELAKEERRAAKQARMELEAALAALPAPQYEYELEAPMDVDEEEKKVETVMDEDMADIEAAERRQLQQEAEKLYEARSSVVKRADLPRPVGIVPETQYVTHEADVAPEQLLEDERWNLLRHDAHAFPVEIQPSLLDGDKKKKKKKKENLATMLPPETPLEPIAESALNTAKELLDAECAKLMAEKVQPLMEKGKTLAEAKELLFSESINGRYSSKSAGEVFTSAGWVPKSKENELESLELEFDTLQEATAALRKKNEKTESKIAVLTGGLSKRSQAVVGELQQLHAEVQNALIEEAVYNELRAQEELGAAKRIDKLRAEVTALQADEVRLYEIYQGLIGNEKQAQAGVTA